MPGRAAKFPTDEEYQIKFENALRDEFAKVALPALILYHKDNFKPEMVYQMADSIVRTRRKTV